jgi:LacI family transcriptional regulator
MDLKELSRRLGLSMTTVSRALNGYPDVSPGTRERVAAMARDLGYTPNAQARRLSSGRAESIGFVLEDVGAYYHDPYFIQLIAGIGEVLNGANYDLVISCANGNDDQLPAYRRLVTGRRVDGLILDRTRVIDPRIDYLLGRRFPFVTLGRDRRATERAFLDMDGQHGFHLATRRLLRLGHTRIAFIGANPAFAFAGNRHAGFARAMREAGQPIEPLYGDNGGLSEAGGIAAAQRMLALRRPPTAFLCVDDLTALGVLRAVRAHGLRVGHDVSVVGYNDLAPAATAEPPLTTIRVPIVEAGRRLAQMLLEILGGRPAAELQEIWTPELVVRHSDGPCRHLATV